MAVLGVCVMCWGFGGFLLFFFLPACIYLVPIKPSVLSQQIPGVLLCYTYVLVFVCLWSRYLFPLSKTVTLDWYSLPEVHCCKPWHVVRSFC